MLPEHELAGAALRCAAREHRREAAYHLLLIGIDPLTLVVSGAQLLQGPPCGLHPVAELLAGKVTAATLLRQPPQLGRLDLELPRELTARGHRPEPAGQHDAAGHAHHGRHQHDHHDLAAHVYLQGRSIPSTLAIPSDILERMSETDVFATDGDLTIRRLRDEPADFEAMARWRAEPHVHEWWDPDEPPPTVEEIAPAYRERTDPDHRTTGCIIELDGRPIGYLQFYRWLEFEDEVQEMDVGAEPGSWGIDIHVGEPDLIDRGVGSRAVGAICRYLVNERGATDVRLTTEISNLRAQRAYEKAGFVKVRTILELDTRDGERVQAWLMVREGPEP